MLTKTVGIALVLLVTLFVSGCTRSTVQDGVLDFALTDLEGNSVSLSDEKFAGKVVLIELWGTWCPPCIDQIPHLVSWQDRYGDDGFEIIALEFAWLISGSKEEYAAGLKGYLEQRGVNYTVVQAGETRDISKVLPALKNFQGFPTSIFVGRDGLVKHVKHGFHESEVSYYEKKIESLLDAENPAD